MSFGNWNHQQSELDMHGINMVEVLSHAVNVTHWECDGLYVKEHKQNLLHQQKQCINSTSLRPTALLITLFQFNSEISISNLAMGLNTQH